MAALFTSSKFSATDSSGNPLAGGNVYTYSAGTTTPKATYTTQAGNVANANPVILDSTGRADIWLGDGAYKFVITDSAGVAAPDGTVDNVVGGAGAALFSTATRQEIQTAEDGQTVFTLTSGSYIPGAGSLVVFVDGLLVYDYTETSPTVVTFSSSLIEGQEVTFIVGNIISTGIDDAQVGCKSSLAGASANSLHEVNDRRQVFPNIDFAVPNNGTTSATASIQAMFDAIAASSLSCEIIFDGTYLITNPNNEADYTCAILIRGLRNCIVKGTKGTKFVVSATGDGASQFGMFRLEQCEDLEFCNFEMDGSGITINGTGSNRSRGFVLVNYDVNSKSTDLTVTNKRIEFHHIYAHDIGGFVGVPPRTASLAATPYTDTLTVRDCTGANLLGQDHYIGVAYVRGLHVYNNRCVNDISTEDPIDNMMVDVSQGCENALVENNYAYGFWFGGKCETASGAGPSGTEIRPSKNVTFRNNTFEEIGNPEVFTIPGPSGGDTYGIKLNGINCKASGNVITPRTIGLSGGGLAQGIAAIGTHADDSHNTVEGNYITGAQYGINHNDSTPTTRKSTYDIKGNRIDDALIYGILAQSNVIVENNRVYRAEKSAISVQSPNDTIIRGNRAYNCAASDNDIIPERVVYYQQGAGAYSGLQEWTDNVILDDRGGSAAEYGYFIRGGTTYANALVFRPGYTTGLLTAITYDQYFSIIGDSMQVPSTANLPPRTIRASGSPASTSPWDGMPWRVGDRAVATAPASGSPKAWVCTVAGTPGTWVSEGNL